jgi:hypothetical protein
MKLSQISLTTNGHLAVIFRFHMNCTVFSTVMNYSGLPKRFDYICVKSICHNGIFDLSLGKALIFKINISIGNPNGPK